MYHHSSKCSWNPRLRKYLIDRSILYKHTLKVKLRSFRQKKWKEKEFKSMDFKYTQHLLSIHERPLNLRNLISPLPSQLLLSHPPPTVSPNYSTFPEQGLHPHTHAVNHWVHPGVCNKHTHTCWSPTPASYLIDLRRRNESLSFNPPSMFSSLPHTFFLEPNHYSLIHFLLTTPSIVLSPNCLTKTCCRNK